MTQEEFAQFISLLKKYDPDLYQLFEIVSMVRKHGYGHIKLDIVNGAITKIEQTLGFKLR